MIRIAPSLLSADFTKLAEEIATVESGADLLHVDIMDGHFVPNITIGPPVVKALRRVTRLPFDCHLMISEPQRYIGSFLEAGANMISVHYEAEPHLQRALQRPGRRRLAASPLPATPAEALSTPSRSALHRVLTFNLDSGEKSLNCFAQDPSIAR